MNALGATESVRRWNEQWRLSPECQKQLVPSSIHSFLPLPVLDVASLPSLAETGDYGACTLGVVCGGSALGTSRHVFCELDTDDAHGALAKIDPPTDVASVTDAVRTAWPREVGAPVSLPPTLGLGTVRGRQACRDNINAVSRDVVAIGGKNGVQILQRMTTSSHFALPSLPRALMDVSMVASDDTLSPTQVWVGSQSGGVSVHGAEQWLSTELTRSHNDSNVMCEGEMMPIQQIVSWCDASRSVALVLFAQRGYYSLVDVRQSSTVQTVRCFLPRQRNAKRDRSDDTNTVRGRSNAVGTHCVAHGTYYVSATVGSAVLTFDVRQSCGEEELVEPVSSLLLTRSGCDDGHRMDLRACLDASASGGGVWPRGEARFGCVSFGRQVGVVSLAPLRCSDDATAASSFRHATAPHIEDVSCFHAHVSPHSGLSNVEMVSGVSFGQHGSVACCSLLV